jgi:Tol biopolymer transport system component
MKLLKFSLFTLVLLMLAIPAFTQNEDYWGNEVYYSPSNPYSREAVYSPDGKWIAFAACRSCSHTKVFVVPAEGGEPIFEFENVYEVQERTIYMMMSDLSFTPDSQEITFVKDTIDEEAGTVVTITPNPHGGESIQISNWQKYLASVNIFTGELRTISNGESPIEGSGPEWSSDGRYLCYNRDGLKILDTETGEIRTLASNLRSPKFTQDDAYIICTNNSGNEFYRIPFNGGTPELLPIDGISTVFPFDISPDGNWVLMINRTTPSTINAYNIQTGELVTLLYGNDKNEFLRPVFSPDGTQVCYIRQNEARYQENRKDTTTPYVIDFDPTRDSGPPPSPEPVAPEFGTQLDAGRSAFDFAISSDEQWIVYTYFPFSSQLYITPLESAERILLYESPDRSSVGKFTFRPNSSEVYFGESDIESVNIDTGEHRVVVEGGQDPSWSIDGSYMVFLQNGGLSIYDSSTEEIRSVADGEEIAEGISYLYPSISSDGSHILCKMTNDDTEQDHIVTIPFEGGEPEVLSVNEECFLPKYSPDGKWILYWGNSYSFYNGRSYSWYLYNVETSENFYLVDPDSDPRHFNMLMKAEWSGDGSKIYYLMENLTDYYNIFVLDFDSDRYTNAVTVESETPESFAVISNYPNPFNPSTTIEFTIPEASHVSIDIYNVAGQKVETLAENEYTEGKHTLVWDASGYAAGVYFCTVRSGGMAETVKMVLVK